MHLSPKSFLAVAAMTVLAAGSASAATVSFTHTTGNTTPATQLAIPFTDTFTLPGFNTSLGTLTGINVSLSSSVTVTAQVTGIRQGFTDNFSLATATLPVNLTGVGGIAINQSVTAGPFSGTVSGVQTVNAGSTTQVVSASQDIAPAQFSAFTSAQNVSLTFANANIQASGNGASGRTFFGGDGLASGTIILTYTYNAASTGDGDGPSNIPEPASMAMLGAGLLALGFARRRRA